MIYKDIEIFDLCLKRVLCQGVRQKVNRLQESKENKSECYRTALESNGEPIAVEGRLCTAEEIDRVTDYSVRRWLPFSEVNAVVYEASAE